MLRLEKIASDQFCSRVYIFPETYKHFPIQATVFLKFLPKL